MDNTSTITIDWLKTVIQDFISTSPSNTMENKGQDPAWVDALVGVASGADPIWQQYKEYVGGFHWTPWEVFNQHCPKEPVGPEELFVSAGNSQALDFLCGQLAREGDTVFIEEPTYFLAHQIFRDHGLKLVGIPVDGPARCTSMTIMGSSRIKPSPMPSPLSAIPGPLLVVTAMLPPRA